jgi:hypothetical protein
MFALASTAFALGASTGWDAGTFRAFYLLGAILNVPWLALGTIYLLAGRDVGRRVEVALLFVSGMAVGAVLASPIEGTIAPDRIPVGKDHFDALPRILAAAGSGLGATVLIAGAIWSAVRYARRRSAPGAARLAFANMLIAIGTLVLSSGGLFQGLIGDRADARDRAFAVTLALGVAVIYAGFLVSAPVSRNARRSTLPANVAGSSSTNSKRLGTL